MASTNFGFSPWDQDYTEEDRQRAQADPTFLASYNGGSMVGFNNPGEQNVYLNPNLPQPEQDYWRNYYNDQINKGLMSGVAGRVATPDEDYMSNLRDAQGVIDRANTQPWTKTSPEYQTALDFMAQRSAMMNAQPQNTQESVQAQGAETPASDQGLNPGDPYVVWNPATQAYEKIAPGATTASENQAGWEMSQGYQPGTTRAELASWAQQNNVQAPPTDGDLSAWADQYYPGGSAAVYGQQGQTQGYGSAGGGNFGFTGNVPNAPQAGDPDPRNRADRVAGNLEDYAAQAMANPSRYDSQLVQQGLAVIDAAIAKARQRGSVNLSEQFAKRGLTGSSVEGQLMGDFEGELQRQAMEQAWNLAREQANTFGADRASAFGFGTDVAALAQNQLAGDRSYGLAQQGLDLQSRGLDLQQLLGQRGLDLQSRGLDNQYNIAYMNNQLQAELGRRGLDLQQLSIYNQNKLSQLQAVIAALGLDIDPAVLLDLLGIGSSTTNTGNNNGGVGSGGDPGNN